MSASAHGSDVGQQQNDDDDDDYEKERQQQLDEEEMMERARVVAEEEEREHARKAEEEGERERARKVVEEEEEEEERRRERARVAREAAAAALCEELLEEVVLVESLRTAHHAHEGIGRAGFKDAMDWLDPRARGRKLFKPTASNGDWLLEEARKASAGSGLDEQSSVAVTNPSRTQSKIFAELPNWSVNDRRRTMRGGGFVQLEEREREGSAQLQLSGGVGANPFWDVDDRALIQMPSQPLADAEPWWRHLDKLSGGGPEAEEAHRLRTEIGRPRRDARGGTPDSLDTPPPSPPESPPPLESSLAQLTEARTVNVVAKDDSQHPPTFLTSTNDMTLDDEGGEAGSASSLHLGLPPPPPPPWEERTNTSVTSGTRVHAAAVPRPHVRPRPQTSIPASSFSRRPTVTRYEKYMSEVMVRDASYGVGNPRSTKQSHSFGDAAGYVSSGTASVMFASSAGSPTTSPRNVSSKQRRGWCDMPRLLSSHRRVRERQVTVVEAKTQKPCTGWGWGSRAPNEQVTASLCSLPILGNQSAKAIQAAAAKSSRREGKVRPATAHVFMTAGGASHSPPCSSIASHTGRNSMSTGRNSMSTTQVGQAWRTQPMHSVRVLDHGHSRGSVRDGSQRRETFSPASPENESVDGFFMDGHPSGW